MISASYYDKPFVVDLLTRAFDNNNSVNYVVKQDNKRITRIRRLMDYSFELCYTYGNVYLTGDRKGAVLLLLPHTKKLTPHTVLLDLKLVFGSMGISRLFKVLSRESQIKKFYPKELMYLWFICVDPQYQGQGLGSQMLQYVINESNLRRLPLYLETSMERNMPFYERFNFKKYNELCFTYVLHMYKRALE
jgi:ribosomal protein S18 acetylase RimI-like enzyme